MAAHKLEIPGMPSKIFSVKHAIIYGHILRFPESILRNYVCIMNFRIPDILEDIFGFSIEIVDADVLAEHEWICPIAEHDILHIQVPDFPEGLVRIVDLHVLEGQSVHLTEKFRPVDDAVAHGHVIAVPDCRTGTNRKVAVGNE